MPASIDFYCGANAANTGLAFFGPAGFGAVIPINSYNSRTFISDETGTVIGGEAENTKWASATGVIPGPTGSEIPLGNLPNGQATLNVRGTFDGPVTTSNARLYVYNGVGDVTSNPPPPQTGLDVTAYEVSHLGVAQVPGGSGGPGTPLTSGNHSWYRFNSATATSGMPMTASPGTSGTRPSGSSTADARHDWYLALSVKPVSAGTKTAAIAFECDYV